MRNNWQLGLVGMVAAGLLYTVWSYSLVDHNLLLIPWPIYLRFQNWIWETLWANPQALTSWYLAIQTLWWASFFWVGAHLPPTLTRLQKQVVLISLTLVIGLLVVAHNALSHDLFNYLFNAKMVLVYQQNPHQLVALDFPQDTWTRFMHNTHTPAPYGYGWTALSLLPNWLGWGKFTLTWLLYKLLNVVGLWLTWLSLKYLAKLSNYAPSPRQWWWVFANPLLLVELIGNGHNDVWMMVPAIASVALFIRYLQTKKLGLVFGSGTLLLFSLSTKYATATLLPSFGLLWWLYHKSDYRSLPPVITKLLTQLAKQWPLIASLGLFLPLLTERSQQFHPWYLSWSLLFLPFVSNTLWGQLLLGLAVSSSLRYLPWLYFGGYSPEIIAWQKTITWGLPGLWLIIWVIYGKLVRKT